MVQFMSITNEVDRLDTISLHYMNPYSMFLQLLS